MPFSNFKDSVVRNMALAGFCFGFCCFHPSPAPNESKTWSTWSSHQGLRWLLHVHQQDNVGDIRGHKRSVPNQFFPFCSDEGGSIFWRTEWEGVQPQRGGKCRRRTDLLPLVPMITAHHQKMWELSPHIQQNKTTFGWLPPQLNFNKKYLELKLLYY